MVFTKLGENFYSLGGVGRELVAGVGKKTLPWRPGLRLTEVRPRSARSDGTLESTVWGDSPWVDGVGPGELLRIPLRDLGDRYFKCPSELIFSGGEVLDGVLTPSHFSVKEADIWPESGSGDGELFAPLTVADAAYVAGLGKLTAFTCGREPGEVGRAVVFGLTLAEFERVGCFWQEAQGVVIRPATHSFHGWDSGVRYLADLQGINVTAFSGIGDGSGIMVREMTIVSPKLASLHASWLSVVPAGTKLTCSGSYHPVGVGVTLVGFEDLSAGMFTEPVHTIHHDIQGAGVVVFPGKMKVAGFGNTIEASIVGYGSGLAFLGKSKAGLVSFRKLSSLDASKIRKRRFWLLGKETYEPGGFYCTEAEANGLRPSSRRDLRRRWNVLTEKFPWLALEDAGATDAVIEQHDEWIKLEADWAKSNSSRGWRKSETKTFMDSLVRKYFSDDPMFYSRSSLTKREAFHFPSYDQLKAHPEAWEELAFELCKGNPLMLDFLGDPDARDRLLVAMITK